MPIYEWSFRIGKQTDFPPYKTLESFSRSAQTAPPNEWGTWAQTYNFDNTAVYINLNKNIVGFDMYDGAVPSGNDAAPLIFPNIPGTVRVGTSPGNLTYDYINDCIYLFEGAPRYLIETQPLSDFLLSLPNNTAFGRSFIDRVNGGVVEYKKNNQEWYSTTDFNNAFPNHFIISDIKIFSAKGQYLGSYLDDTFVPIPYVRCGFTRSYKWTDGAPQQIYGGSRVFYYNTISSLMPQRTGDKLYILAIAAGNVPYINGFLYGNPNNLSSPLITFGSTDDLKSVLNGNGSITWTTDPNAVQDPDAEMENPDYIGPQYNPSGGSYVIGGGDDPQPEGTEFTGGNYDPNSAVITTGEIQPPGFSPSSASGISTWAISGDELFNVTQEIFKPELDLTKVFISKDQAFVNAFYVPFDIQQHDPSHCVLQQFNVGYATTTLQLYRITGAYNNTFDGGSVNVREYYGTFLDYAPYTSVILYIPYIGYHELDTNMVMNKTVNLKFSVDLTMGILTAFVFAGSTLINTFSGQMGVPTSINGMDLAQGFQSLVKFIGLTTVSVPAIAAPAAGLVSGALESNAGIVGGLGTLGATAAGAGLATAAGSSAATPHAVQMGTAGAENWLTAYQTPYIIIERREDATPAEMVNLEGYASCYTATVSEFTGYVQASTIKLQNTAGITEEENNMILDLLRGGIYID